MKLIYCPVCEDVFRLFEDQRMRLCRCGRSGGRYTDNQNAEVLKGSVSVAFNNNQFLPALRALSIGGNTILREAWKEKGKFEAWVRPNSFPGNPHTREVDQ